MRARTRQETVTSVTVSCLHGSYYSPQRLSPTEQKGLQVQLLQPAPATPFAEGLLPPPAHDIANQAPDIPLPLWLLFLFRSSFGYVPKGR
jgi:hypothetical protein